MKSLFTILLLGLFISSQAQNISQSQVRQFNAVTPYRVFGRGAGVGTPSFLQLDSNWIPQLNNKLNLNFGTQGSILFRGATGISENNTNFYFDGVDKMRIGAASLATRLNVLSNSNSGEGVRVTNTNSGINAAASLSVVNDAGTIGGMEAISSNFNVPSQRNRTAFESSKGISIISNSTSGTVGSDNIQMYAGNSFVMPQLTINPNRHIIFGDSTDLIDAHSYVTQTKGNAYIRDTLFAGTVVAGSTVTGGGSTGGSYTLPIASASTLGGIKVGSGLSIDATGILSSTGGSANGYAGITDTTNAAKVFNVMRYGAVADSVTDATAAIQSAINAAFAAGGGTVYFPYSTKPYIISGSLITSLNGVNPNCQIYIPLALQSAQLITIRFMGATPPNFAAATVAGVTRSSQGVVIMSTIQGTGARPSVFSTSWASAGIFGSRNYVNVVMDNMIVRTQTKSGVADIAGTMSAINFEKLINFSADELKADITSDLLTSAKPTNETYGIVVPNVNNAAELKFGKIFVEGYKYGAVLGEHTSIDHLISAGNVNGLVVPDGFHSTSILHGTFEANNNNISLQGTMPLSIFNYETEHNPTTSYWFTFASDINQVSGASRLQFFNSNVVKSGVGVVDSFKTVGNPLYTIFNGQGANAANTSGFTLTNSAAGTPYITLNATNATNGNRYSGILNQNNSVNQWSTGIRQGDGLYHIFDAVSNTDRATFSTTGGTLYGSYTFNTGNVTLNNLTSTSTRYISFNESGTYVGSIDMYGSAYSASASLRNVVSLSSGVNNLGGIALQTNAAGSQVPRVFIANSGRVMFGDNSYSPTARIHIQAGTATANTAPFKLTSGVNLTTPEAGAIEYNGTNFFATPSNGTRQSIITGTVVTGTEGVNQFLQTTINGTVSYIPIYTTLPQ